MIDPVPNFVRTEIKNFIYSLGGVRELIEVLQLNGSRTPSSDLIGLIFSHSTNKIMRGLIMMSSPNLRIPTHVL